MHEKPANVLILGAGCSVNAGIPVLGNFIDTMWEYAIRGKVKGKQIPKDQLDILIAANEVRLRFENYHSRAFFDSRNIEDILSLLTFEKMGDNEQARKDYQTFLRAITITIDLSCNIALSNGLPDKTDVIYRSFWNSLFSHHVENMPAIVTFNYDLVLERALWNSCHAIVKNTSSRSQRRIGIKYSSSKRFLLELQNCNYNRDPRTFEMESGTKPVLTTDDSDATIIPYYKLHGSLNWPHPESNNEFRPADFASSVQYPLILPPVFNKVSASTINDVWVEAIDALRTAKNIIIVGYSLPKTDIYMQYFLKAAVGPNINLNQIFVFNPALFKDTPEAEEMKERYRMCFSPQFQNRIMFQPEPTRKDVHDQGTFANFVLMLRDNVGNMFFRP